MNLYMIEAMELEHDILSTSDMCNIYLMEKKVETVKQNNNTINTKAEPVEKSKLRKVIDKIIQSIKNFIEKIKKFFTGDTKKMMEQVKNDHSKGDPECERSVKELRKLIKKGQYEELTLDEWRRYNTYEEIINDYIKDKAKVAAVTGGVIVSGAALYGLYMDLWGIKKSYEKDTKDLERAKRISEAKGSIYEMDKLIENYQKRHKPLMLKVNKLLSSLFSFSNISTMVGSIKNVAITLKVADTVHKKTGSKAATAVTALGTIASGIAADTVVSTTIDDKLRKKFGIRYQPKDQRMVDGELNMMKRLKENIDKVY